jgi:hypothetical protein
MALLRELPLDAATVHAPLFPPPPPPHVGCGQVVVLGNHDVYHYRDDFAAMAAMLPSASLVPVFETFRLPFPGGAAGEAAGGTWQPSLWPVPAGCAARTAWCCAGAAHHGAARLLGCSQRMARLTRPPALPGAPLVWLCPLARVAQLSRFSSGPHPGTFFTQAATA